MKSHIENAGRFVLFAIVLPLLIVAVPGRCVLLVDERELAMADCSAHPFGRVVESAPRTECIGMDAAQVSWISVARRAVHFPTICRLVVNNHSRH